MGTEPAMTVFLFPRSKRFTPGHWGWRKLQELLLDFGQSNAALAPLRLFILCRLVTLMGISFQICFWWGDIFNSGHRLAVNRDEQSRKLFAPGVC